MEHRHAPLALLAALVMPFAAVPASAQVTTAPRAEAASTQFELTVPSIMRGPELVGETPLGVQWSDDSRWVYFRWKPGGRPWHEPLALYRVRADGGTPERLSDAAADSLGVILASGSLSTDERYRAVSYQGDIYVIDRRSMNVRRLTDTRATKSSPVFSRDGRTVYFISDNNLFAFALGDGTLRQVTDVRTGPEPAEPRPPEGQRGFLVRQQQDLFEHIRLQVARRDDQRARTQAREARETRRPIHIQRDERVASLAVEPGGRYAVMSTAITTPSSARRVTIPFWVTETGYTEAREFRSHVGDAQTTGGRMGIVSLTDGDVRWLDVARATLPPGSEDRTPDFGGTRFIGWNDAGTAGLVAAQTADFKQAWLWSMDAATGNLTLLFHDQDEAWLAGPCPFWQSQNCVGWLPNGRAWFVSERTGFAHLYSINADGSDLRQLTSGDWEVHNVALSPRRDRFMLTTNEGSPHQQHLWSMPLNGGNRTQVTTMPGRQVATVSPDGNRVAFVHSYANVPPELYIAANRPGAQARRITQSPTAEWLSHDWIVPEIVHVPASDGARVPARIYRPQDVGAQPNGAAVIFVHGAGYLQNVHNWWSTYYREYMFHHLLASRGYVVLDMDFRASQGYGRDWRTAIYRHMGGRDLAGPCGRVALAEPELRHRPGTRRHLRRFLRRVHHAHGPVQ
jgi:dipeptidyl aminopeptidase/acylaminoacyl peptidase